MSAAPVIPIRTLYAVESDLLALLDCADTVAPEQEQDYVADLAAAIGSARDKRDAVARYLAHCESQIDLAKAEIERLRERKAQFENSLERLKAYVVRCMNELGVKKLEGSCVSLSLRKNPPAVEVVDEAVVPVTYRTAEIKVSGDLANIMLDALPIDAAVALKWSVDKRAVKDAIDAGDQIAGAKLAGDRFTLVRR